VQVYSVPSEVLVRAAQEATRLHRAKINQIVSDNARQFGATHWSPAGQHNLLFRSENEMWLVGIESRERFTCRFALPLAVQGAWWDAIKTNDNEA
jgi:hypothetical protein